MIPPIGAVLRELTDSGYVHVDHPEGACTGTWSAQKTRQSLLQQNYTFAIAG